MLRQGLIIGIGWGLDRLRAQSMCVFRYTMVWSYLLFKLDRADHELVGSS